MQDALFPTRTTSSTGPAPSRSGPVFVVGSYSPASRKILRVTKFHTMTMAVATIFTIR